MNDFKAPMSVGRMSSATADEFITNVIVTVIDITLAAWPRCCRSGIQRQDKEDDITDRLRWEMVAEKNRRDPRPQLRFDRETQRDDLKRKHPTGLIDVYVTYSFDEKDYFAMECKKVADRHHVSARRYVCEGICRFASGKYSPGHAYGAMIGFVTRGSVEETASFVGQKAVAYDGKKTRLETTWGWHTENQFGEVPNLYSTKHRQRRVQNTILLLHLFLAFPCPSRKRA